MPKGRTLRLTSPDHDVAVKYSEDGYVVSETELYGIQRVNKLEYVKEPIKNGTCVYIANSKYKIEDILTDKVPSTKIFVR